MQRTLRTAMISLCAAALGVAGASALAQTPARGEPVKLGLIDIYSGGFAFIADSIRTGFQIALDEANAAGGFRGRPFQLVTADMGTQVEKAVTEGRRMILEEKIKFVTVGIHSGAAIAVGNLGREHKVLVLGGFATTKRLTGEAGHPYVARANLSTVEIGRVIAEYVKSRPEIKRVATIAPDYEYGARPEEAVGPRRVLLWPWLFALGALVLLAEMYFVHRLCPVMNPAVASSSVVRHGILAPTTKAEVVG